MLPSWMFSVAMASIDPDSTQDRLYPLRNILEPFYVLGSWGHTQRILVFESTP